MKRTAKHFAAAVLAGSVALGMGAAPAVADGDRDHHDGYRESRYDDRDRGEWRHKDGHRHDGKRKHHWGDRDGHRDWDGHDSEKRDIDWYRDRVAGAQEERKVMKVKAQRAKVAHRDGRVKKREFTEADRVTMHQRALVFKLSRAEAFLAGLADRLTDSGIDASVKEPLLAAVASYQARVAQLQVAAENATTKEELKAVYVRLRELGMEFVGELVELRRATSTPKHS